jgi:hypothetical protein
MRAPRPTVASVVAVLLLAGCGTDQDSSDPAVAPAEDAGDDDAGEADTGQATQTVAGCPVDADGVISVDEDCFDGTWPLTVPSGELYCTGASAVVFRDVTGLWNVNGAATTQDIGEEIEPIWAENPDIEGTRINIGDLISAGLDVCS